MATIIEYRKKFIELFDQMQSEHGHCERLIMYNSKQEDGSEVTACRMEF